MAASLTSRERLLELSGQEAGDLATVTFPVLLLAHALQGERVELRLRRGHVDKRIFFESGVPVDCRSNLLHETIGRYLVQQSRLSEEAYQECLRESAARGALIGELLLERGVLDSAELFRALQQNLARKLFDVFTWREGQFAMVRRPPPTGSSLKVKVPQLVLTGVARFAPTELVGRWVAPFAQGRLVVGADPLFPLADLRLPIGQARLLALLEERALSFDELAHEAGQDAEEMARGVAGLALLGAVALDRSQTRVAKPASPPESPTEPSTEPSTEPRVAAPTAKPKEPAAEVPSAPVASPGSVTPSPVDVASSAAGAVPQDTSAAPPPVGTPAAPEDAARLARQVHETYLNFRRLDAFDLLGVAEDAPLAFVRYQYLDFARRFAPWRFAASRLAPLAEQAQELFLAGALAFSELADDARREALRFRRQRAREEAARQKTAGYFQIQTDLLDPEAQFSKGIALRDGGKLRAAIQQLEFAVDCDSGNAIYLAELAWTRFLEAPAVAARSFEDLRQAMRLDPQAGLPIYYAGEVCAALGDRAQAEVLLRRSIKPLTPDRRPLEALRRLATEKRR